MSKKHSKTTSTGPTTQLLHNIAVNNSRLNPEQIKIHSADDEHYYVHTPTNEMCFVRHLYLLEGTETYVALIQRLPSNKQSYVNPAELAEVARP